MIDGVRLRIVLVALSGWVNRHQLEVIEYLRRDQRRHVTQDLSSEVVAVHGESTSLGISQPQAPPVKVLFEDVVLFPRTPSCGGIGSSSPVNGPLS